MFGLTTLLNAQQMKTYNGEYFPLWGLEMDKPKAVYSYYENEDYERIYNGDFACTFQVSDYLGRNTRQGSIKGKFKDGEYEGAWTIIYPYFFEGKKYSVTMTCFFENGVFDGPVKVVVKDGTGRIIGETKMEFKNGIRSGELTYYNKMMQGVFSEIKGQYTNDERSGKWTYVWDGDKGIIEFDEYGQQIKNFQIDHRSGEKTYGVNIYYTSLDYGGVSFLDLMHVLCEINPNEENKSMDIFQHEY